jgi:hypothetical protein
MSDKMNDTSGATPLPQRRMADAHSMEPAGAWGEQEEMPAQGGGSLFIGQHVGINTAISLQPDVVAVPRLGLISLLQRAHQVRQLVPATEPDYDKKPASRQAPPTHEEGRQQNALPARRGAKAASQRSTVPFSNPGAKNR